MQMDVDKAIDDFDFHVRTAAEGYYDMVTSPHLLFACPLASVAPASVQPFPVPNYSLWF